MHLEISLFQDIEDSLFIKVIGVWNQTEMEKLLAHIQAKEPTYVIIEPTEFMLTDHHMEGIEETNPGRRFVMSSIANLMQENPSMLYLIINRNDNPFLKSGLPYFEKQGLADRYLFPKDEAEAQDIIRAHQANS